MRCFIAIELPAEVKKEFARIQKELPEAEMNLVDPKNIHLTIKFFGEVEDKEAENIKKALSSLKSDKFDASLGKIGVFFHGKFIRVLWVGLEPKPEFNEVHEKLDEELLKFGFKKDKGFESHATLARVKFVRDRRVFEEKISKIKIKPIDFKINKVCLKKSTLTDKGPIYENLLTVKLN